MDDRAYDNNNLKFGLFYVNRLYFFALHPWRLPSI